MGKVLDLTGQQFERWTVLKRVENNIWKESQWLCRCECGEERIVIGKSLVYKRTKSCGCGMREWARLPEGEAGFNSCFGDHRYQADKRGIAFDLSKDQVRDITSEVCHYCGVEPSQIKKNGDSIYIANGIDRIDSDKGYHIDNVVPCCAPCNYAKRNMTYNQFKTMIARIYHNLKLH